MDSDTPTGCMCELCHPNWFMGRDGDFVPNEPEPLPPAQQQKVDEDKKPVVKPVPLKLVPALAH